MKTVLCYGDSITWGYNPEDASRYGFDERWPGILQGELGDSVRVIEESLPGRTTNSDSPYLADRNGSTYLPMLLESHSPIDIFVLMLGTNDLFKAFGFSAPDIAASCMSLIWKVQKSMAGPGYGVPEILLIAPPKLGKLSVFMSFYLEGRQKASSEFAREYKKAAEVSECHFLDASKHVRASKIDGVHLEPAEQRKLAMAVKNLLADIL